MFDKNNEDFTVDVYNRIGRFIESKLDLVRLLFIRVAINRPTHQYMFLDSESKEVLDNFQDDTVAKERYRI